MKRRDVLKGTAMLLGYAFTGSTISSLMSSCESGAKLSWEPNILSTNQAKTLSAIVDRLLPATSTPGALDVGVDKFIDKMLYTVFPKDIQEGFAGGIDSFNERANEMQGKAFTDLDEAKQNAVLQEFEETSGPLPGSMWGFSFGEPKEFPFYRMMKELALLGYFHSEKIGTEVLEYDPIPGTYQGCIAYGDVGRLFTE